MPDAATEARELIRIVRGDSGLPGHVRRRAGELAALGTSNPDLVLERLADLHRLALDELPMHPPLVDYARCISVEVFWRFNLKPEIKDLFVSPEDYRRFVESDSNPSALLAEHIGPQLLVPAQNSWLVPASALEGRTGAEAKVLLNFSQDPPYVIMILSVATMMMSGVLVREPRGVDAIPSRLIQWFPDNVPDERIDRDIPRSALESIEWRP